MTPEDVEGFARCIDAGGIALFPADTVYGLATGAESEAGVARLYALKGRPERKPAAVMFFDLDLALAALPELEPRTRAAVERLLPGPLTCLLPNPGGRYPLACGPDPATIGLRVPRLAGPLAALASMAAPVLQSSANPSGGPDARRLDDVDEGLRRGVDLELDGGELPGVPSTVVDLRAYERDARWTVVREGAVSRDRLAALLTG